MAPKLTADVDGFRFRKITDFIRKAPMVVDVGEEADMSGDVSAGSSVETTPPASPVGPRDELPPDDTPIHASSSPSNYSRLLHHPN